jgi:hypothetical protein
MNVGTRALSSLFKKDDQAVKTRKILNIITMMENLVLALCISERFVILKEFIFEFGSRSIDVGS